MTFQSAPYIVDGGGVVFAASVSEGDASIHPVIDAALPEVIDASGAAHRGVRCERSSTRRKEARLRDGTARRRAAAPQLDARVARLRGNGIRRLVRIAAAILLRGSTPSTPVAMHRKQIRKMETFATLHKPFAARGSTRRGTFSIRTRSIFLARRTPTMQWSCCLARMAIGLCRAKSTQ
jgi:hypothetical protein